MRKASCLFTAGAENAVCIWAREHLESTMVLKAPSCQVVKPQSLNPKADIPSLSPLNLNKWGAEVQGSGLGVRGQTPAEHLDFEA